MDNLQGCWELHSAIATKCAFDPADETSYQFLNCDKLPGCPNGRVDAADITACTELIEQTSSCDAARAVTCAIKKDGCTTPSDDPFGTLAGWDNACNMMIAGLLAESCVITALDCENFLGCRTTKTGAYSKSDVEASVTAAVAAGDCTAMQTSLRSATIRSKFCLDTVSQ
ncbi:MAG: hypothetical protein ACI9WU_000330 [Myxococcota bacterium]|jgi:hypothetical protein